MILDSDFWTVEFGSLLLVKVKTRWPMRSMKGRMPVPVAKAICVPSSCMPRGGPIRPLI